MKNLWSLYIGPPPKSDAESSGRSALRTEVNLFVTHISKTIMKAFTVKLIEQIQVAQRHVDDALPPDWKNLLNKKPIQEDVIKRTVTPHERHEVFVTLIDKVGPGVAELSKFITGVTGAFPEMVKKDVSQAVYAVEKARSDCSVV